MGSERLPPLATFPSRGPDLGPGSLVQTLGPLGWGCARNSHTSFSPPSPPQQVGTLGHPSSISQRGNGVFYAPCIELCTHPLRKGLLGATSGGQEPWVVTLCSPFYIIWKLLRKVDSLLPYCSHRLSAFITADLGSQGRIHQDPGGFMCGTCLRAQVLPDLPPRYGRVHPPRPPLGTCPLGIPRSTLSISSGGHPLGGAVQTEGAARARLCGGKLAGKDGTLTPDPSHEEAKCQREGPARMTC